jgi:hypothetical protein
MFDTFYGHEAWDEKVTDFWTFGPHNSPGTYVLTVLGIILMVVALIGWVWLEHKKLTAQAERLRAAGMGR